MKKKEEDATKIIWNDRTIHLLRPASASIRWNDAVEWRKKKKSKINEHIPFSVDDERERRCNKTTVYFQQVKHFIKITLITLNPD